MAELATIEKFSSSDLTDLRSELQKGKMDSWQTAEVVSRFLTGRGYGVNTEAVRKAVPSAKVLRGSHDVMQAALEAMAYVM